MNTKILRRQERAEKHSKTPLRWQSVILPLACVLMGVVVITGGRETPFSQNEILAIPAESEIKIGEFSEPLTGKDDLISIRSEALQQAAAFLRDGTYKPAPAMWERVLPDVSWCSEQNYYLNLRSPVVDGPPVYATALTNPLILLDFEFVDLTVRGRQGIAFRNDNGGTADALPLQYPLRPLLTSFVFKADEKRASASYAVTEFSEHIAGLLVSPIVLQDILVLAHPFNAADLGFEVMKRKEEEDSNIASLSLNESTIGSMRLFSIFGPLNNVLEGSSCNGLVGGSAMPIIIKALPAHAAFELWKRHNMEDSAEPDFVYEVEFR